MKGGKALWTIITASTAEKLFILSDYLQLQDLMDQSIVWMVKGLFLNTFELSDQWKLHYPQHYDEIDALLKGVTEIRNIQLGEHSSLIVTVNGNEYFDKFEKVRRFSSLKVKVNSTVPAPPFDLGSKMILSQIIRVK
jgi:hypothetical protein